MTNKEDTIMRRALVIPVDGPLQDVDIPGGADGGLDVLQALVGGSIQAIPLPEFIPGADAATGYVNEEGKFDPACKANMRATDFLVPGIGLFFGDYVAGPLVLCGFNPGTGEHDDLPDSVERRARRIEWEAGDQ